MTIEQLKAELLAAALETREAIFRWLGALRRSCDPERARRLAEKLDDPARWVTEADAAQRLRLGA